MVYCTLPGQRLISAYGKNGQMHRIVYNYTLNKSLFQLFWGIWSIINFYFHMLIIILDMLLLLLCLIIKLFYIYYKRLTYSGMATPGHWPAKASGEINLIASVLPDICVNNNYCYIKSSLFENHVNSLIWKKY